MSYRSENTEDDISILRGATIESIDFADWDDGFEKIPNGVVRMRVRVRDDLNVNGGNHAEFEIWQDPEGNGPGFLSFVGP